MFMMMVRKLAVKL